MNNNNRKKSTQTQNLNLNINQCEVRHKEYEHYDVGKQKERARIYIDTYKCACTIYKCCIYGNLVHTADTLVTSIVDCKFSFFVFPFVVASCHTLTVYKSRCSSVLDPYVVNCRIFIHSFCLFSFIHSFVRFFLLIMRLSILFIYFFFFFLLLLFFSFALTLGLNVMQSRPPPPRIQFD